MSLKQSIVVVNEYTIKTGNKSGSRGGTPGDYVRRYMARDLATENLAPIRLHEQDDYIVRYMARKEATETLDSVPEIKHRMKQAQKDGGVAFGNNDVSLSDEKLRKISADIQKQFDMGKTVMKTVLSFDEEYLREHGLIDEDFKLERRGDYRGNLDQLKLRMAIMNGMDRMARNYDDLEYVGVIQVDTRHVHCHLAMVDRGRGNIVDDGTQKGKLSEREKRNLRRGIDMWLDDKQSVKMMSSAVMYDRQNAVCHIKKFTHKAMNEHTLPQFLIACLPEDRTLWRASTNRKEMRKANALVREYVLEVLEQPQSGYREAMNKIQNYADVRSEREGLTENDRLQMIRNGQEQLIADCMNGVYSILRTIPEEELVVRTPMLEIMSMDYEEMAAESINDPMMEFGFRLRSYSSRLNHHKKEYHKYENQLNLYNEAEDKSEDSKVMADFFNEEISYNAMLMVKYQYFLSFLPTDEDIEEDFEELMQMKENVKKMQQMQKDETFRRMTDSQHAEEYGLSVYGQTGGRYMRLHPSILDTRIEHAQMQIEEFENNFRSKLRDSGMSYDGNGIVREKMYPFDEVKALDLHHLGYDFPYQIPISKINIDRFVDAANKRYNLFMKAKDYLENTNQDSRLRELPETDILFMKEFADKLRGSNSLPSSRKSSGQYHRIHTLSLDNNYNEQMKMAVESAVISTTLGES